MPFINLIAEQRRAARHNSKLTRAWFFTFAAISAVSVCCFGFMLVRVQSLKSHADELVAKTVQLQPLKDTIEANNKQLASLTPRLQTLTTARLDTERWSRVFDHVSLVIPPNVWLTQVTAQQGSEPNKQVEVSWTGMSADQDLVGELMLRLQRSPDLGNVQLKFTDLKKTNKGEGIEFQISCEVVGTAEKIIADKGAKQS